MSTEIEPGVKNLDATTLAWVAAYKEAKENIALWGEKLDVARANIEASMGDAELGCHNGNPVVRWAYSKPVVRIDATRAREVLDADTLAKIEVEGKPVRSFHVIKDGE